MTIDVGPSSTIGGSGLGRTVESIVEELMELFDQRPAWMKDAACREHPEVSFFPGTGRSFEPARVICRSCLVRDACLDFALEQRETDGMWGGMSGQERRELVRLRRAS